MHLEDSEESASGWHFVIAASALFIIVNFIFIVLSAPADEPDLIERDTSPEVVAIPSAPSARPAVTEASVIQKPHVQLPYIGQQPKTDTVLDPAMQRALLGIVQGEQQP
jgi:hypothetical protein